MSPVTATWAPTRFGPFRIELPAALARDLAEHTTEAADGSQSLLLNDAELGQLELTTEPAGGAHRPALRERLSGIMAALKARDVMPEKLRSCPRVAAGVAGEEVALRIQQGANTFGLFTWEGTAELGAEDVRVVLQLSCSGEPLDRKLEMWDHLLDSMTRKATT